MLPPKLNPTHSVRTSLHLSPSVAAAAIVCAQRRGLRMQEWLDKIVVDACADTGTNAARAGALTDDMTVELFAHVSSRAPGLFTGRWKLLYERVRLDDSLWKHPVVTVAEMENGISLASTLNLERLRCQWPQLVAAAFAL